MSTHKKDEFETGQVSDDDLAEISDKDKFHKTGQDHSTEDREDMEPTEGVGSEMNYYDDSDGEFTSF